MAIMIPDIFDKNQSDAERKVFEWLKNDKLASDWIVLHSLSLSKHITLIKGEADFVIIAPRYGVFVLEVKGGRVEVENGKWKYTDRNNNSTYKARGPFEQASDCIFSIFDLLRKKYGSDSKIGKLLFGYGVVMPDIEFTYDSPEFNNAQVCDIRNGCKIGDFVVNLSNYFKNNFKEKYNFFDNEKMPTKSDAASISSFLRPNFEVRIPLLHTINESEEMVNRLTEEQYNTIDQISDNKRILVLGSAGTGKTIIALHTLINKLIQGEERVALFCFNSRLGDWLRKTVCDEHDLSNCYVGSFHSFLRKTMIEAKIDCAIDWDDSHFYTDEIVLKSLEAIEKTGVSFDFIIVDEFQDLFDEKYFMLFDSLLNGGFKRGHWLMLADFNNQDIYSHKNLDEKESLNYLEDITSFARSRLTINCRNTVRISKEIETIVDIKYKTVINQIDGLPVTYKKYTNEEEQKERIQETINNLLIEKIQPKDIIVLSSHKFEDSIASKIGNLIEPYDLKNTKKIQFSTIQGFKGLERKIVFLVDVDSYSQSKLIYIAYSRARSGLFVFENKKANLERADIIVERMSR